MYGIQATGTHVVDTLRMLFKDTSGEISHVVGIYSDKNDFCAKDDQNIDSIIYFKKGLIAYVQCHNIKDYDIFDFNILDLEENNNYWRLVERCKLTKL